jgi:hypothetical protein
VSDHKDERQDRLVGRVAASAFYDVTDSIIDAHTAVKVLAITVAAEIGGIAMILIAKDLVRTSLNDAETDVWIYAGIAVFVVGFLTVFAIYKLAAKRWPHQSSGLMIWVVSVAAGVLNIAVIYTLVAFEMH